MIDRGEWESGKVYQPMLAKDPIRDEGKCQAFVRDGRTRVSIESMEDGADTYRYTNRPSARCPLAGVTTSPPSCVPS